MAGVQQPEELHGAAQSAHKHDKKPFFVSKKNGKSPAQDDENAPLLQESEDRGAERHESQDSENGFLPLQQKVLRFLQLFVVWVLENLVIVILACLLAAGTVAVCVYGCEFRVTRSILRSMLTPYSDSP